MTGTGRGPAGGDTRGPVFGPLNLIHRNNCSNPLGMRVPALFPMPEQPWKEGEAAGRLGLAKCPYLAMTTASWAWSSGYTEGRAYAKT